jgi:hypothetical protein
VDVNVGAIEKDYGLVPSVVVTTRLQHKPSGKGKKFLHDQLDD